MPVVVWVCSLFVKAQLHSNMSPRELSQHIFTLSSVRIVAGDAVMVIATGNGVVKEDISAKLEVHRAYLPGL